MTPRRSARVIAAILVPVALLVALLAWGASSPPGSSPDDDYHMASIWCAGGLADGRCEQGAAEDVRLLPAELLKAAGCFAFDATQSASCPRFEDQMRSTTRGNWAGHAYPPGFYAVMGVFVGGDLSTSIVAMRVVNAVLYVGVLTALFYLLPRRQRPALVWGAAITIVPLGVFLIPSTNPSSWALLSATGLWVAVWGFFEARGKRRWALAALAVLLLMVGANARADAAAYAVVGVAVGTVLGWRRTRSSTLAAILPLALVIAAIGLFFVGGQSAVVSGETTVRNEQYALSTLVFINAKLLPQLWAGTLGTWGLGWLDTEMPPLVWVTALGLFAAFAFWGLRAGGVRKWLAVAGVAAALVVVPMYILVHDGMVVGTNVQPRYIYPLVVMFAGVALVALSRLDLGLRLVQLVVVVGALAVANAVALHTNMRRYITGLDVPSFNLNAPVEWWWNAPVPPMAVWVVGTIAFAAALGGLAWAARMARPIAEISGPRERVEEPQPSASSGS